MMYAIRNRRTKKWVYGTDYRYHPYHQRTSKDQAITYDDLEYAEWDFRHRKCGKDYEIIECELIEKGKL